MEKNDEIIFLTFKNCKSLDSEVLENQLFIINEFKRNYCKNTSFNKNNINFEFLQTKEGSFIISVGATITSAIILAGVKHVFNFFGSYFNLIKFLSSYKDNDVKEIIENNKSYILLENKEKNKQFKVSSWIYKFALKHGEKTKKVFLILEKKNIFYDFSYKDKNNLYKEEIIDFNKKEINNFLLFYKDNFLDLSKRIKSEKIIFKKDEILTIKLFDFDKEKLEFTLNNKKLKNVEIKDEKYNINNYDYGTQNHYMLVNLTLIEKTKFNGKKEEHYIINKVINPKIARLKNGVQLHFDYK